MRISFWWVVLGLALLAGCAESTPSQSAQAQVEQSASGEAQQQEDTGTQAAPAGPNASAEMLVYKSPTCGCCGDWIKHMEGAGFALKSEHPEDLAGIKTQLGIAENVRSCHTAVSPQGYVFEGHIPARLIQQFLASPPEDAIGLSVPGMPVGSPGMESGDRFMPYQVMLLRRDGSTAVYASINTLEEQY